MHRITLKGQAGEVRWGYRRAALVRDWVVSGDVSSTTLTAAIGQSDAFALTQTPLEFVVPREDGRPWVWPIQSISITGGSLHAHLGT